MKDYIRIGVFGILGRMGQTFINEANKFDNLKIVFGVDINECEIDGVQVYKNCQYICRPVDVIVDFSNHTAINTILKYALREKIPAVICSTGHTAEELMQIRETAKQIPILLSPNMSFGANFLIHFAEKNSKNFVDRGFQVDILETHHIEKKDSPSGTALAILQAVLSSCPNLHLEKELTGKREQDGISVHSMRLGNEIGTHELIFSSNNEVIKISHKVNNKAVFALGAIDAVEFITKQKPGYYTVKDVITKKITNQKIGNFENYSL